MKTIIEYPAGGEFYPIAKIRKVSLSTGCRDVVIYLDGQDEPEEMWINNELQARLFYRECMKKIETYYKGVYQSTPRINQ